MALSRADCNELRAVVQGKATNYRYLDVARWLTRAEWSVAGQAGSHRTWRHASGRRIVLVDAGRGEVLPVYVKRACRAMLEEGGCPE
jgi:hypothetical protein